MIICSINIHRIYFDIAIPSGNKNNLYPARMNGIVDSSVSGHNQLVQLIGARRDLKSENSMVDDATKNLASKVQSVVESIILQTVK